MCLEFIQTLETTTDGITRGLSEFKLQIFISLQMADIQKEEEKKGGRERGEDLLGVQRQEEIRTICASP